jgi:5-methyltetrahydrofolate--homocysteine methyltransferase
MSLVTEIANEKLIISDGAMGTELQARGLPVGKCPELWNLENPEVVKQITADYIAARARLVETNTFGANRFILARHHLEDKLREINAAGVTLARQAINESGVGGKIYLFASLGPTGNFLEPLGDMTTGQLADAVTEQVAVFRDAGVDGVCVETMTDITEAEITVRAVKDAGLACIALMCFDKTPRGYFTMMGVDIPTSVRVLIDAGADIIGSGCGGGCNEHLEIAREIRALTSHPLAIHPNAGKPEMVDGNVVYPESPEVFGNTARELVQIGANIIGGCCGSTPAHIRAICMGVSLV